jgi:hypothetical protein
MATAAASSHRYDSAFQLLRLVEAGTSQRPLNPPQTTLSAENGHRFEQSEADCLAGESHAQRVNQLADWNTFGCDKFVQ